MTDNNNNTKSHKPSHILYEDWMSANDFLVRRDFYGGTASPNIKSLSVEEMFTTIRVPTESYLQNTNAMMTQDKFENWQTYATCRDELFEYSIKGIESIKIY